MATGEAPAPPDVTRYLKIDAARPSVATQEYVYIAGGDARLLVTTYVPRPTRDQRGNGRSEAHHEAARGRLKDVVVARLPRQFEHHSLNAPLGQPVLDVLKVGPCTATRLVMRGDLSSMAYDILAQ